MGFLGDIKKLIFGAKSVTKSAADKAVDYGKDKGGDLLESADDLLGKAADKAGDLGSTIVEKGGDLFDKAKDAAGNLTESFTGGSDDVIENASDAIPDADPSMVENLGGKIIETGSNLAEKAGNVAENVGGKIMDASAPYVEKAGDVAENVGGKIIDAAGSMMDKAKELGGNLMDKTSDLVEKANEAAEQDSLDNQIDEAKSWDERLTDHVKGKDVLDQKDPPIGYDNLDESLLDDKGSFWDKAEKFADGNYSGETKNPSPPADENDIFANTEERQKQLEENVEKEPFKGEVKGFTDNDDDGDPVIDDAILDED